MNLRILFLCLLALMTTAAQAQIHHELNVSLEPDSHRLTVTDRMTLTQPSQRISLLLHAGLNPQIDETRARLMATSAIDDGAIPLQRLDIELAAGARQLTLRYAGEIHHPVEQLGAGYGRGFSVSPGLISPQGVYLSGASYWVAQPVEQTLTTFSLTVELPVGWRSLSQGSRIGNSETAAGTVSDTWTIDKPQQEIYLIAAAFEEYQDAAGAVDALVLLREPDAALARKYLDVTRQYIELYGTLIGPYPYGKFALVENFWETGYGMPSFTLLGPRVIRFPFILHSSYPHEILHNWWGNGVYVDYQQGNWSEGLTSYLADHLIKEQRSQGVEYRRQALQKYTDYVRDRQDFALSAFRSRHSAVSEAVGYGKTLMLFHMLRLQLGDERFVQGLRRLYRDYRFKVAAFADVAQVFGQVSGRPLDGFFRQWVERSGAPVLRVRDAKATATEDGFLLSALIEQTQAGDVYDLNIPVAVHLAGVGQASQSRIAMETRQYRLERTLPARPLLLEVDPEFDVFRRLHRNEIPPALTQAFGAERALLVLPAAESDEIRQAYRQLAAAWSGGNTAIEVTLDTDIHELPADKAVWLLGWDNRFRPELQKSLPAHEIDFAADTLRVAGQKLTRAQHSAVVVARHPGDPDLALCWLATDRVAALPGLARKLPHYGKYGYLAFSGDEPENIAKGEWPVSGSPMSVEVEQTDGYAAPIGRAELAPRQALASLPPAFSAQRMSEDIGTLAAAEMAGRGLGSVGLERAGAYIAKRMRQIGLQPGGGDGGYFQSWTQDIDGLGAAIPLKNVIGVLPGSHPAFAGQSVVLAAHYDHLGRGWPDVRAGNEGKIHPGADDNASGVAVMLELARALRESRPQRSIVFIAFSGEEAGTLGSRYYLQNAPDYPADQVIAMLNLDTVGRLGDKPLLVLGSASAREWVHIFRGAGYVTGVNVQPVAEDPGSSDHSRFIEQGIPAVQFFSGAHADYHAPGDSSDKIDAAGLIKVAAVVKQAVEYLASRPDALNAIAKHSRQPVQNSAKGRRASLGSVPDFAFAGTGVRLSGVTAGSAAEQAGLRAGDIIVALNHTSVSGLQAFSKALKALRPGDMVTVRFLRNGDEHTVSATLSTR